MDMIFNMHKIRYQILDKIISENCDTINQHSNVRVFINLEDIILSLSRSDIDKYLKVTNDEKYLEMISCILNLGAHYRKFFTKNKLYSEIYFYMSYPLVKNHYKNRLINSEYRKTYESIFKNKSKNILLTKCVDEAINFSKIITEYIKGVYIVNSCDIESSVIPYIINENRTELKDVVNFIVTKDRYDYQYVNIDNFYILRPKKEDSYLLNKDNMIGKLKLEEKILNDITVDSCFMSFILSFLGDKKRNIPKISGIGLSKVLKMLNIAISNNDIGSTTNSINLLSNIIKEPYKDLITRNFYTIDLASQYKSLNLNNLYSITEQIKDKFDNVGLKNITTNHFNKYPISLMELTDAIELLERKERKNIFNV